MGALGGSKFKAAVCCCLVVVSAPYFTGLRAAAWHLTFGTGRIRQNTRATELGKTNETPKSGQEEEEASITITIIIMIIKRAMDKTFALWFYSHTHTHVYMCLSLLLFLVF
jgi:hypothetical protein